MGVQPTGRETVFEAIDIVRISNGKIVEEWIQADLLGLLQQLGAFTSPSS